MEEIGDRQGTPSDNNFLAYGIIASDRTLHPHAYEVRKVHQNIAFERKDSKLEIRNKYFFKTLDNFAFNWTLLKNGEIVNLRQTTSNYGSTRADSKYRLTASKFGYVKGGEYFLQIEAQLINEEGILEAKTPLAFGEFQLTKSESIPYAVPETNSIEITESVNQIKIYNKRFELNIDSARGVVGSFIVKGEKLWESGPMLNLWRPGTDNDFGANLPYKLKYLKDVYQKLLLLAQGINN